MEGKHTPGPWGMCGKDRGGCVCGIIWGRADSPEPVHVATCHSRRDEEYDNVPMPEREEQQANMHLIAAAPEIAICLEAMLKITCGTCEGGDDRCITPDGFDACLLARQAKAALAKARGE